MKSGACGGFGLAAVIDYLNQLRHRDGIIDHFEKVSSRMLYEMGKRHDRWPGEAYEGSSARGAMKGWHKHGVCGEDDWPYSAGSAGSLTTLRQQRALANPLGAYYRILPSRTDMQAALNEVGAVFATAYVHAGWKNPVKGRIEFARGRGHRTARRTRLRGSRLHRRRSHHPELLGRSVVDAEGWRRHLSRVWLSGATPTSTPI